MRMLSESNRKCNLSRLYLCSRMTQRAVGPSLSGVQLFLIPWAAAHQASFPHHLLEFAQVHVHCTSDAIQPFHTLMPSSTSALNIFQNQGLFQWVGCSHCVTKISELQLQHQSFQWVSKVDFLKIDWLDFLAVQGTLKSLLQHHSLKASILWPSAFFTIQFSQLYMTTGKIIALTTQTFVGKVISLLFNALSRFVIAFMSRSNY